MFQLRKGGRHINHEFRTCTGHCNLSVVPLPLRNRHIVPHHKAIIDDLDKQAAQEPQRDHPGENPDLDADEEVFVGQPGGRPRSDDEASAATEEEFGAPDDIDIMEDALFATAPEDEMDARPAEQVVASPLVRLDSTEGSGAPAVAPPIEAMSSPAAPPPPSPPPAPPAGRRVERGRGMFVLFIDGGKLTYYGGLQ